MDELPLLKTFLAVYRLGSATKAAERLALTQPGVSGHVRSLEGLLKKKLFSRTGRGIAPTAAAHDLARAVAPHLDALDVSFRAARASARELAGTVHLGGPAEFLSTMISPKLGEVLARGVRVRTRCDLAQRLTKDLGEGALDLAILTLRIRSPAVGYSPLFREEFILVGSKSHRDRIPSSLPIVEARQRIEAETLLAYAEDLPIIRRYWRDVFNADAERQPALVLPDLRGIIAAVASGAGISVVPKYLCEQLIANGELTVLLPQVAGPVNEIQLAWNKYALRHPRVSYVRDYVLASFSRYDLRMT